MATLKANTEAIKKAVKASAGTRAEFRIEGHAGLVLRTRSTGGADWYFYFTANKLKKLRLGPWDGLTLADAAKAAAEARSKVARGADPTFKTMTFEALARSFLEAGALSAKTKSSYAELFGRDVFPSIGAKAANQVAANDIAAICQAIQKRGSPTQAQRTKSAIGGAFSWGMKYAGLQHNPARDVPHQQDHKSKSTRVPTDEMIIKLWKSLDENTRVLRTINLAIKLLILTGQRRDEVGAARVTEIDLTTNTWAIDADTVKAGKIATEGRMKNGRDHCVYLSRQATALFREAIQSTASDVHVFAAEKDDAKLPHIRGDSISHRVRAVLGSGASIHDFRRAFGGWMKDNGYGQDVRDLILAHKERGADSAVDDIYSGNAKMAAQCRAAWQEWADHVEALVAGKSPSRANASNAAQSQSAAGVFKLRARIRPMKTTQASAS